jgi:hypothetical protein
MPDRPLNIFSGSSGLNNRVDPVRVPHDYRSHIRGVSAINNAVIDDTGRVGRVPGYSLADAGAYHSLTGFDDFMLAVRGDALVLINHTLSVKPMRNVTEGARMSFAGVVVGETKLRAYYSNGHEMGMVDGRESFDWPSYDTAGPDSTRYFTGPPIGHLLAYWSGRMFIAERSVVFYSEPYNVSKYDLAHCYMPFGGFVRFMAPVDDGLWIGDTDAIYFVGGSDFDPAAGLRPVIKAYEPALMQAPARVNLGETPMEGTAPGWAVITERGVYLLGPGGQILNATERDVKFQDENGLPLRALYGAGAAFNGRYFGNIYV